jgi:hypothetical protein
MSFIINCFGFGNVSVFKVLGWELCGKFSWIILFTYNVSTLWPIKLILMCMIYRV